MEAKHPADALLQVARTAFGTLTRSLDERVLSPAGDHADAFLHRLQLVPKAEFDRLKAELDTLQQKVTRLEDLLSALIENKQADR